MEKRFSTTEDKGEISDGYHTFNELYEHRHTLFIALCRLVRSQPVPPLVWRSRQHADGSYLDGWFLLGIGVNKGQQISYHLPDSLWKSCDFAAEGVPDFDGHTSADVLKRLKRL